VTLTVDQRAARARALLADEVLQEALAGLRAEKVAILTGRTPDEDMREARHAVWALDAIKARLQSFIDDQAMAEARLKKGGTV
jgi:hypothetical protein